MSEFVMRVGSYSAQGLRPNNEDNLYVNLDRKIFLVADGMGGQDRGEQASGMAAEIIPRVVYDRLTANEEACEAVKRAMEEANEAIVSAGQNQPPGRRMGTTAVLALQKADQVFVSGLGDSRAYLIRDGSVEQLTVDHSVAQALVASGALTPDEARNSPYQHVLHKFLGCTNMTESAEVKPFTPQVGDRLLLATDGLTNHITDEDLSQGVPSHPNPQDWAEYLVQLALDRGSKDNVTCVIVAFDAP